MYNNHVAPDEMFRKVRTLAQGGSRTMIQAQRRAILTMGDLGDASIGATLGGDAFSAAATALGGSDATAAVIGQVGQFAGTMGQQAVQKVIGGGSSSGSGGGQSAAATQSQQEQILKRKLTAPEQAFFQARAAQGYGAR